MTPELVFGRGGQDLNLRPPGYEDIKSSKQFETISNNPQVRPHFLATPHNALKRFFWHHSVMLLMPL